MSVDEQSACAEALLRAAALAPFVAKSGARNRAASAVR